MQRASPGTVEVTIYGEEFIEAGIPASEVSDGWAVTFDSFLVTIAEVTLAAGHGAPAFSEAGQRVFDLARPTGGMGTPVTSRMVGGGAYDHVNVDRAAMGVRKGMDLRRESTT